MNKSLKTIGSVREGESSNLNTVGVDDPVDPYKQKHINKLTSNVPTSNIQHLTSNVAITLIALIITIIVLLILAGVTLNMIIGDNGIISKAQLAKEKTNAAQNDEEQKISSLETELDKYIGREQNISIDEFETLKSKYNSFKERVALAITSKGINTSADEPEDKIIENIGKISSEVKISEQGTFNTGTINRSTVIDYTLKLKNTYTEEQNAKLIILDSTEVGDIACYMRFYNSQKIIGDSISWYIYNCSGTGSGNVDISYCVITE